jgi:hypothetical protein
LPRKALQIIVAIVCVITVLIVLLFGALLAFVWAISQFACGSYLSQEAISPNGEYKAVVYQRDCGATTGFSTQISLLDADDSLGNRPGNVFRANGHPDDFAIKMNWEDDTHLVIEHNGEFSPIKAETSYRGVTIRYMENRTP